ncbi:MAG: hypothetical protein A2508_09115 [Candidatus Lambdaproteobacteria bacterium RIFOXYD12_FULL_49_8]|uniref:Uncharacterized protein n=1 Tax=Candidatus Lambdaproteobacteria bacterium RIFOXYD2_FULL_50_16 TaxID=1817772 RepID=A0A1F6GB78_9PROT|nr:MAG: hypothetical protein A2527_07540 [Candidatus Lambdaproteobacteria bacterium RIFOXYD2_FULL_50_16]OGG97575.1 MAG: hypothetical protein A2508_09115 [Candidatus Lambdaproteobacteria bacterium RIFOXYD12_FULL_49_8]
MSGEPKLTCIFEDQLTPSKSNKKAVAWKKKITEGIERDSAKYEERSSRYQAETLEYAKKSILR